MEMQKNTLQEDVNQLTENMEKLSVEPTKKERLAKKLESITSWADAIGEMKLCKQPQFKQDLKEVIDKLHEIREERTLYPISTNSLYHLFLQPTSKSDSTH